MGTYKNCYSILSDVREALNEYTPAYVQGSDTSGTYQNRYLTRKINEAQQSIYNDLIIREEISEEFIEEASLVGVSSVLLFLRDFGQLVFFKDDTGAQIHKITQAERRQTDDQGSASHYYRKGNTLVLDAPGLNTTCTLIYRRKPRDIHSGAMTDGAATSMTLDSSAKKIADYYNGMDVENETGDWIDTITDYTSSRVATITNTGVAGHFYGIVPDMPEMFHNLIALQAVILIKTELPVAQEKAGPADIGAFNLLFAKAITAYTGQEDIPAEDYFTDEDAALTGGII